MKKLLLFPMLALGTFAADAQLALQNFNSAGYPGWTMFNVDMKTISSALNTKIVTTLGAQAWMKWPQSSTDSIMITTSLFSPAGKADRWLVTPSFNVTSANMMITWEDQEMYSPSGLIDEIEVLVSTTGGATPAAFTTSLCTTPLYKTGAFGKKGISLGAFNGQTVKVAFRAISNNIGVVGIDDVQTENVTPKTDLKLLSVTPADKALFSYGAVSSSITIKGTVKNNGTNIITGYTVKYQQGSGPIVSDTKSGLSIIPFAEHDFSISTPFTLPAAGNYPVKVWIEYTGDADLTNDSSNTTLVAYNTKPAKKILAEEGTGTWCGWCPRGLIYMDSIRKVHPNNFSLVAVHNGSSDPMKDPVYDAAVSAGIGYSYPGMWVDRREVADPSELFDVWAAEKDYFGVAGLVITPTLVGSTLSVAVAVTPHVDLSGDYRLALALTEDDLKGTTSGWAQVNYYSGGASGPMQNASFNFATLPGTVPAATMHYDMVARTIIPSPTGAAGSLPSTMTSGTTYNYTFSGVSISSGWNPAKMRAVVMLLNANTGAGGGGWTLNSENAPLTTTGIVNPASGVKETSVYPNPASDVATIKFSLTESTNVDVQIVDAVGKTMHTVGSKNLAAGSYELPVSVANLASGLYMVQIITDKGTVSERLTVVK